MCKGIPYADAVVNPTKGLEDGQTSILNEFCLAGYQEEIIIQYLERRVQQLGLALWT